MNDNENNIEILYLSLFMRLIILILGVTYYCPYHHYHNCIILAV
jgi:hypothetical protein